MRLVMLHLQSVQHCSTVVMQCVRFAGGFQNFSGQISSFLCMQNYLHFVHHDLNYSFRCGALVVLLTCRLGLKLLRL